MQPGLWIARQTLQSEKGHGSGTAAKRRVEVTRRSRCREQEEQQLLRLGLQPGFAHRHGEIGRRIHAATREKPEERGEQEILGKLRRQTPRDAAGGAAPLPSG